MYRPDQSELLEPSSSADGSEDVANEDLTSIDNPVESESDEDHIPGLILTEIAPTEANTIAAQVPASQPESTIILDHVEEAEDFVVSETVEAEAQAYIEHINSLSDQPKSTQREVIEEFIRFLCSKIDQIDFPALIRYLSLLNPEARSIFLLSHSRDLLKKIFISKENILTYLRLFEPLAAAIFLFSLSATKLARLDMSVADLLKLENIALIIQPDREKEVKQHLDGTRFLKLNDLMRELYCLPDDREHNGFVLVEETEEKSEPIKLVHLAHKDIWSHISSPIELEVLTQVFAPHDRLTALQLIFRKCPEHSKPTFKIFDVLSKLAELIPSKQRDQLLTLLTEELKQQSPGALQVISKEIHSLAATSAVFMMALSEKVQPLITQAEPVAKQALADAWTHRTEIAATFGEILFTIQCPGLAVARTAFNGCYTYWQSKHSKKTLTEAAVSTAGAAVTSAVATTVASAAASVLIPAAKRTIASKTLAAPVSVQIARTSETVLSEYSLIQPRSRLRVDHK